MAQLTTSYQRISTIGLTYGEIRTYAKYSSQSTTNNTTTYQIKMTYYARQWLAFASASATLDGTTKGYGYTTMNAGETTILEVNRTKAHNTNGSSPTVNIATKWTASYGGGGSTSANVTFPAIKRFATITNSPASLTDEDTPWFSYNNPANGSMSCWLEINPVGTHFAERTLSGRSGTFTWDLTETERNNLRKQLKNSNTGKIRIGLYTTVGGVTGNTYVDRPFTIINANPIFNNFTFEDTNSVTLALTGDSSVNINGYSNIKATISTLNKAIAQKQASMSKYRFSIGDSSFDINYSDSADVSSTINNATNGTYNIYAVDSRNNSTLVTKLASTEINYSGVYIDKQNTNIQRDDNQVGDGAVLTLNGTFWNDNFGNVSNSLNISYQLKKSTSSTWLNGTTTITPTITDNSFSFNGYIASNNQNTTWDLDAAYDIKIIVSDELSTSEYITVLNTAVPTMSFDREGVGIMCSYDQSKGGGLQVYGEPIGEKQDVYSTSEVKTNKVWIDGKPIYRKVISVRAISSVDTDIWIAHGISNLDKTISMDGFYNISVGTIPINFYNKNTPAYSSFTYINTTNHAGNIGLRVGIATTGGYITLEYTKTTD